MDHQDAVRRFRKRRAERMNNKKPKRLDSVDEYRKRRDERIASRLRADDDEEGRWVTTENNHKVHISEEGTPDKGNKHVLQKMGSGKAESTEREQFNALRKELEDLESSWKKEDIENVSKRSAQKEYFEGRKAKNFQKNFNNAKKYYGGESLEEVNTKLKEMESNLSTDEDFDRCSAFTCMKSTMETFGEDAMKKSYIQLMNETYDYESTRREKRAEMMDKLSEIAAKAYPKLSDCDSAISLRAKLMKDKQFTASMNTREEISMGKIDDATASDLGGAVQNIFDKFPKLSGKLAVFSIVQKDEREYGSYDGMLVSLNSVHFNDRETFLKTVQNDVERRFHPEGTASVQGIITHEYGHVIDRYLAGKLQKTLGGRYCSDYVIEKVSERLGMDISECQQSVSEYAMKNNREFLAESFAEYMCSPHPRKVALEVGRVMEELMDLL